MNAFARLLAGLMLLVPITVSAQDDAPGLPPLRLGTALAADFHVKLQMDWRRFPTGPLTPAHPTFDLRRARLGIEGTLFSKVEYQVERNVDDDAKRWADVYANVTLPHRLQLRAGRFKMPLGLEELTSISNLDLVYRALVSDYLAPGRDIGAMAHGAAWAGRIKYQFGAFRSGGDNARKSERAASPNGRTFAGRVVVKPWDRARRAKFLSKLAVGVALTSGGIPDGANSVRGHDFADDSLFHPVYVNGRRQRLGTELEWRRGSTGIRAERIHVAEERRGQGVDDEDLPDAIADGWYLSGTWLVTGEKKTDHVKPAHPVSGGGIGAIEAAARIESMRFGTPAAGAAASRDARARVIAGDADRAITCGLNWYLARAFKLQFALIRQQIERGGLTGDTKPGWARVLRLQVAL